MRLRDLLSQILACTDLQLPAVSNLKVFISAPRDLLNYKNQIYSAVYKACKQAGLSDAGCQAFAAFVARRVAGFSHRNAYGQDVGYEFDVVFDFVIGSCVLNLRGKNFYKMSDWSFLDNHLAEIRVAFGITYVIAKRYR